MSKKNSNKKKGGATKPKANNDRSTTQTKPKGDITKPKNTVKTNTSYNGDYLKVDLNTDYQALKKQAESKGDYANASKYEALRNAKINYMNQMGTNKGGYKTTNDHVNQYMAAGYGTGKNNEGGVSYEDSVHSFKDLGNDWNTAVVNGIRYRRNDNGMIQQDVGGFGDGSTHWYNVGDGVNRDTGELTFKDPTMARNKVYDEYIMSGGGFDSDRPMRVGNEDTYNYIADNKLVDDGYVSAMQGGNVGAYNTQNIARAQEEIARQKELLAEQDENAYSETRADVDNAYTQAMKNTTPQNFDFSYIDDDYAEKQRANYIAQQRSINQAQDMLRTMGYSGGMSESTLRDIDNQYMNNRYIADKEHEQNKIQAKEQAEKILREQASQAEKERFDREYKMQMLGMQKDKLQYQIQKQENASRQTANDDRYKQAMKNFDSTLDSYKNDFQAEIDRIKNLQSQGYSQDYDGVDLNYKYHRLNGARNNKISDMQKQEELQQRQARKDYLDDEKLALQRYKAYNTGTGRRRGTGRKSTSSTLTGIINALKNK